MSRAIVTFAVGAEHEQLLEIALPSFQTFADLHGHELQTIAPEGCERPPSWWKLIALGAALADHDEALWLDADTIIVEGVEDLDAPEDCWQALVEHKTGDGTVPNLGVWLVRRPMLPILEQMWAMTQYVQHGWWEQAAMIDLMGYTGRPVALRQAPTELYGRTHFLDAGWNVHPWDQNKTDLPRIMHATMHRDRAERMRRWTNGGPVRTHWASGVLRS